MDTFPTSGGTFIIPLFKPGSKPNITSNRRFAKLSAILKLFEKHFYPHTITDSGKLQIYYNLQLMAPAMTVNRQMLSIPTLVKRLTKSFTICCQ